ncbi:MAG: hypothetical protein NTZ35_02575 [Ignavibacteriales bacterium]|nr:hypothetical protein [Ignavibacteriales bacterium]
MKGTAMPAQFNFLNRLLMFCLFLSSATLWTFSQTTPPEKIQWEFLTGPQGAKILRFTNDGDLLALTNEGVYILKSGSSNWCFLLDKRKVDTLFAPFSTRIFAGQEIVDSSRYGYISQELVSVVVTNSGVIVGSTQEGGIFNSNDNGQSWKKVCKIKKIIFLTGMFYSPVALFATCIGDNKIFRSTDEGFTWTAANISLKSGTRIKQILFSQGGIYFASTDDDGVYISRDNGLNWTQSQLTANQPIYFLTIGDDDGRIYAHMSGVFIYDEKADSWLRTELRIPSLPVSITHNEILIRSEKSIERSVDGGKTYQKLFGNLPDLSTISHAVGRNSEIVIGTTGPIFKSDKNRNEWITNDFYGKKMLGLTTDSRGNIFLLTDKGLFESLDDGTTWSLITPNKGSKRITITPDHLYLLSGENAILISSDKGKTWNPVQFRFRGRITTVSSGDKGRLFVGTTFGLYTSTDKGVSWKVITENLPSKSVTCAVQTKDAIVYMGREDGSILKSTDMGNVWQSITKTHYDVFDFNPRTPQPGSEIVRRTWPNRYVGSLLCLWNGNVLADIGDLFISLSSDTAWFAVDFHLNSKIQAILEQTSGRVVLASESQILISSETFNSWRSIEDGLPVQYSSQRSSSIDAIALGRGNKLLVAIGGKGLFRSK